MGDLAQALSDGKAGRLDLSGFLSAFAAAQVWVPVVPEPAGGAQLWVFSWLDVPTAAAFSSPARLDAFGEVPGHVVLTGSQLAATWPPDLALALDPGAPDAMVLPGAVVAGLQTGGRATLRAGSAVAFGEPGSPPAAFFAQALAAAAAATPGVAQVWLVQVHEERLGPQLVGGVQLRDGAEPEQVMPRLQRQVTRALPAEQVLDLVQLTGSMLASAQANLVPLLPAAQRRA